MKKDTIKRLVENFQDSDQPLADSLSSYLADQLANERSILEQYRQIREMFRNLDTRYKYDKDKLDQKLKNLQIACPHYETTFHSDASGNNDSETICDWCKASIR